MANEIMTLELIELHPFAAFQMLFRDSSQPRLKASDERDHGRGGRRRELTARADGLRAQCEALAASTQDEATRATLARVAGRLSVIGRAAATRGA